ncbi:MAG TPA: HepT-like ribonuclease domain-containing protein [Candidatus Tectomicrobia bacterium]|nr:HepT-like ribonuclease domain-containing protein [Candidatus Tectomicrobia bacterium]
MLDHAREAYELGQNRSREHLESDRLLNLALVRLLEIVGEAASRIPAGQRALYREIPWSQIIGIRNRLIHSYDFVDFTILWQTIT